MGRRVRDQATCHLVSRVAPTDGQSGDLNQSIHHRAAFVQYDTLVAKSVAWSAGTQGWCPPLAHGPARCGRGKGKRGGCGNPFLITDCLVATAI